MQFKTANTRAFGHSRLLRVSLFGLLFACEGIVSPGAVKPNVRVEDALPPNTPQVTVDLAMSYFPGESAAFAKKRVARLTRVQIDAATKEILPAHVKSSVTAGFPRDPLQTNYEYADNLQIGPTNFTPYGKWVEGIAASVRAAPKSVINCDVGSSDCLSAEAQKFLAKAFRGTLDIAQRQTFVDFYLASVKTVGLEEATADLVDATLTSPAYIFRDEVSTDASGFLAPPQRLQALSFTLADAPPDALKLASAAPLAAVETPEATARTVDSILATPQAKEKLARFMSAWIEVKEPSEFTIAQSVFPEFTPVLSKAMVDETSQFLNFHLSKSTPRLKDVTQATQSFVSDALSTIYGRGQQTGTGPVELDTKTRLGVFTLPAVLAGHSGPATTRMVKRGVFFARKVMCVELGAPPPGADTVEPPTGAKTERARIEGVTTPSKCQGCHSSINPLGAMQESYDPIGRFRTTDEGQPVDASVSFKFLDEGTLTASTSVEALKGLTNSARFNQCFVRQLFRFYMGREETADDAPLLRKMFVQFINNDEQNIIEQLRLLANSTRLSQRAEMP